MCAFRAFRARPPVRLCVSEAHETKRFVVCSALPPVRHPVSRGEQNEALWVLSNICSATGGNVVHMVTGGRILRRRSQRGGADGVPGACVLQRSGGGRPLDSTSFFAALTAHLQSHLAASKDGDKQPVKNISPLQDLLQQVFRACCPLSDDWTLDDAERAWCQGMVPKSDMLWAHVTAADYIGWCAHNIATA